MLVKLSFHECCEAALYNFLLQFLSQVVIYHCVNLQADLAFCRGLLNPRIECRFVRSLTGLKHNFSRLAPPL